MDRHFYFNDEVKQIAQKRNVDIHSLNCIQFNRQVRNEYDCRQRRRFACSKVDLKLRCKRKGNCQIEHKDKKPQFVDVDEDPEKDLPNWEMEMVLLPCQKDNSCGKCQKDNSCGKDAVKKPSKSGKTEDNTNLVAKSKEKVKVQELQLAIHKDTKLYIFSYYALLILMPCILLCVCIAGSFIRIH